MTDHLAKKPKRGIWQIDFTIDGRRVRESSGTTVRRDAQALARARYQQAWQAANGIQPERPRTDMTLARACARFADEIASQGGWREDSQASHLSVLQRCIGAGVRLVDINDDLVSVAVRAMQGDGLAPATINRYLTTLRQMMDRADQVWHARIGHWTKRLHAQKEPPGRQVCLTPEQAQALLAASCGHLRPMLILMLSTGLRRDNAVLLTWDQVSLDLRRAIVTQKRGRRHGVDLTDQMIRILTDIAPPTDARHGAVWRYGMCGPCACQACQNPALRGQPITTIRRPFAAARKAAGLATLPDDGGALHMHDMRHTFASTLQEHIGDLALTQAALGHENIRSTARYVHLTPGRRRAEIETAVKCITEENSYAPDLRHGDHRTS